MSGEYRQPEVLLPQSDAEWLAIEGFRAVDIHTSIGQLKGALVEPRHKQDSTATIMFGGITRKAASGGHMPLAGRFYGELARLLQKHGSTSAMIQLPGIGESEGRVGDFTVRDRILSVSEASQDIQNVGSVDHVNLLGTSMGGYIALRAGYEMLQDGKAPNQLVLLSPAAYPSDIEDVCMGQSFRERARSDWSWDETVIQRDIKALTDAGTVVRFYAYEQDDPPIPKAVQAHYEQLIDTANALGHVVSRHIIPGVKHSFRRLDTDLRSMVIDEYAVVKTAKQMSDLILRYNK